MDDNDVEYILKLFGLASRHIKDEFKLFDEFALWRKNALGDAHKKGSCGFDEEKFLDDFNFPPRIGRHGVHGCNATQNREIHSIGIL